MPFPALHPCLPCRHPRFWLVKDIVLFSLRYMVYMQQGMHYM